MTPPLRLNGSQLATTGLPADAAHHEQAGAQKDVRRPVMWNGSTFNHVQQKLPRLPGPPPRLQRQQPTRAQNRGGSQGAGAADQAGDTPNLPDVDADGTDPDEDRAPSMDTGFADAGSHGQTGLKQDPSEPDEPRLQCRQSDRRRERELNAMDFLRRLRIPGSAALFGPPEQAAPDPRDILDAMTASLLNVLGRAPGTPGSTPPQTALTLAASHAAIDRLAVTPRPPAAVTLRHVKDALLAQRAAHPLPKQAPPNDDERFPNARALLPLLLLNAIGRPRTATQHATCLNVLGTIRSAREFCPPTGYKTGGSR